MGLLLSLLPKEWRNRPPKWGRLTGSVLEVREQELTGWGRFLTLRTLEPVPHNPDRFRLGCRFRFRFRYRSAVPLDFLSGFDETRVVLNDPLGITHAIRARGMPLPAGFGVCLFFHTGSLTGGRHDWHRGGLGRKGRRQSRLLPVAIVQVVKVSNENRLAGHTFGAQETGKPTENPPIWKT